LHRAELVLEVAGEEEAQGVVAARDLRAVEAALADVDRRVRLLAQLLDLGHAVELAEPVGDGLVEAPRDLRRVPRGQVAPLGPGVRVWVLVLHGALLRGPRPPRVAWTPLLGRDDDDAVRRVGAVERRRTGPLHNFNILNLFRADVAQAARARAARGQVARAAVEPHAVDD